VSVQLSSIGSEPACGAAAVTALGPGALGEIPVGMLCSCVGMSFTSPAGEVIVVRVAGEVDMLTISVMRDALADSLARGPCDLIVDLASMTFCDIRGLALLVQTDATATGISYAIAAAPDQARRVWALLWPVDELPMQFPSAAVGVLAAMARQVGDDRARWSPKRGPGWIRRWPADRSSSAPVAPVA
jgi:anti-anti-sigma factor